MRDQDQKKMRKYFNEEGWDLMNGPCDTDTKRPNAGVGIAVKKCHKNSIKIIPTKILTDGVQGGV